MSTVLELDYYVLDVLANDIEDLESVLRLLNSPSELGWRDQHPTPFSREEVVPSLIRSIKRGLVEACVYSEATRQLEAAGPSVVPTVDFDAIWFRLTSKGRIVLDSWDPPPLPPHL
jgi:hypothetical protein